MARDWPIPTIAIGSGQLDNRGSLPKETLALCSFGIGGMTTDLWRQVRILVDSIPTWEGKLKFERWQGIRHVVQHWHIFKRCYVLRRAFTTSLRIPSETDSKLIAELQTSHSAENNGQIGVPCPKGWITGCTMNPNHLDLWKPSPTESSRAQLADMQSS